MNMPTPGMLCVYVYHDGTVCHTHDACMDLESFLTPPSPSHITSQMVVRHLSSCIPGKDGRRRSGAGQEDHGRCCEVTIIGWLTSHVKTLGYSLIELEMMSRWEGASAI